MNLKTQIRILSLFMVIMLVLSMALIGCNKNADVGDGSGESTEYYKKTFKRISEIEYNASEYIKLPTLSELKISMKDVNSSVEYELISLALSKAEFTLYKEKDSAEVQLYDTANITYTGASADESIVLSEETLAGMTNASSTEGSDLVIGSGTFIKAYVSEDGSKDNAGFEDQLIGAKVGETRVITVTFPDMYGMEELQGVEVDFTVKINSVNRPKTVELTDEVCKTQTNGEYKTVEEYRTFVEKYYKNEYAMAEVYSACESIKHCEEIVNLMIDKYVHEEVVYAHGEELTEQEYLEAYEKIYDSVYETAYANAVSYEEEYTLLKYLFELCEITLSEEELEEKINEVWEENKEVYTLYYGFETKEAFVEYVGKDELITSYKYEKLFNCISDYVTVTE